MDVFTTLARTGLFFDALQRDCLQVHGLAFTEFSVLRLLQRTRSKAKTPSFLAKEIVCTTGAMTKVVDRLERAGFVRRTRDTSDRRAVNVTLTAAGSARATEASASYRRARRRVLSRLSSDEANEIEQTLGRLLGALEIDREKREESV